MSRMEGKVVLVTGGASGIGRAVATRVAAEGGQVVIADLQDEAGTSVAAEIGGRFEQHDVTQWAAWEALAGRIEGAYGRLDGLVNSAGILTRKRMMDTDEALFRRIMDINQVGPFFGMRSMTPLIAASGGGSIVNLSSLAGLQGQPSHFAYGTSKWAVRGMTKYAALELAGRKIRVNSVHPGLIETPMTAGSPFLSGDAGARVPIGRVGQPEDVAAVICFLLSDDSGYVSGGEYTVDGGWAAN